MDEVEVSKNSKDTTLRFIRLADDILLIRKSPSDSRIFITTGDSILISLPNLVTILNYLVKHGYLPIKAIEGILEEYHTL